MIILDSNTKSLELLLDSAATTQLSVTGSVVAIETTNYGVSALTTISTASNNTTAVTLVAAPSSGTKQVKFLSVYNPNSETEIVTIRLNDNSTYRTIVKISLSGGDMLEYSSSGWQVLNSSGQAKGGPAIDNDAVTNAMLTDMSNATFKARNTAGSGDPEDITASQLYGLVKTQWPYDLCIAVSDETTAITTGAAKVTLRVGRACTLTAVKTSLTTASSSGVVTVDVNKNGTTIFSTNPSIDATETTSLSGTAAVLSTTSLAADDVLTFDIDAAGTGAAGLKVWLLGVLA